MNIPQSVRQTTDTDKLGTSVHLGVNHKQVDRHTCL